MSSKKKIALDSAWPVTLICVLCACFLLPAPCFIFSDSSVIQQVNLDTDSMYRIVRRSKLVVPLGNESSCRAGIPVSIPVGLSVCRLVSKFMVSGVGFRFGTLYL